MATIGGNIKRLRLQAGWSQGQLASRIGKTRAAISQYESDVYAPRMGVIEDLAAVFGVSKSSILETNDTDKTLSPLETELIDLYRHLSASAKRALLVGLRDYANG